MAGVAKQIIGSFEDIGKDIAHEVAKVPVDIAGKALESLGTSSQKGQKGNQMNPTGDATKKPEGALAQLDQTTDQKIKQSIAREALAQLAGNQKQKEPTVQERLAQEEAQKKEALKKQQSTQMTPLAAVSSKPKRGNLYGAKQKKTAIENKAARQD
jgi:hypothetical protein